MNWTSNGRACLPRRQAEVVEQVALGTPAVKGAFTPELMKSVRGTLGKRLERRYSAASRHEHQATIVGLGITLPVQF